MGRGAWRIYYESGPSLDGEGLPDIPLGKCFQVQVIVQEDKDHGRELLRSADYYLWRTDLKRWIGVAGELSAMLMLTAHTKVVGCLLWGSMMDPYRWAEIQQRASKDSGFPEKTGERKRDAVRR